MPALQKREKVLVGVAGAVAVAFGINFLVCGKSETPETEVKKGRPVESAAADAPKSAPTKKKEKRVVRERKNTVTFASWVRDPFAETWKLAELDDAVGDSSALILRGVIRKGNQAYVLIGDQIMKEGEVRGDLKIVSIERDFVVCRKGRKIVRLVIGNNAVPQKNQGE